jgi:putative DNA primase/helicase
MGETDFNEMSKTSILKKLTGGDLIGFEYKNKDPFEEENYAKILIATNNLPSTTDKTIGFYRRWVIIDFPNQFSEKKDVLLDIPEEEYNSLALKCTFILKELLSERKFTNEGNIEEKKESYENHSNPFELFMKEFTEESTDSYIWKWEFSKRLNEWAKENRFREIQDSIISAKMKKLEIDTRKITTIFNGESKRWNTWSGIKWKDIK